MDIFNTLKTFETLKKPIVLTIGNFDGFHLGHHKIIEAMKTKGCSPCLSVVSFSNHPSSVLDPKNTTSLITTNAHKQKLLQLAGVDHLTLLPFTKEFSRKTAEEFLTELKTFIDFSFLVLGHDASVGKDRKGTRQVIEKIAKMLGFEVELIPPYLVDNTLVSSSLVRVAIQEGNIKEAKRLLGRPYSIYSHVTKGLGTGKKIGFPTANFDLNHLATPPFGVFAVDILHEGRKYQGIANVGVAPTVKKSTKVLLEAHAFDCDKDFYNSPIEVIFKAFIRPEQEFESIDLLKNQIVKDVEIAKISS